MNELLQILLILSPGVVVVVGGLIQDKVRDRRLNRESEVRRRVNAGLPEHVRCGCDICAAWRKARYG